MGDHARLFDLISAALLAGCINSDEYEPHRAINLEFNGGPVNGANYFATLNICNLVNRYSDGKYNCAKRASPGPVANVDQVLAGAVEFGISRSDYVLSAVQGTGIWENDPQPSLLPLSRFITIQSRWSCVTIRISAALRTWKAASSISAFPFGASAQCPGTPGAGRDRCQGRH
ncbi:MAG: hypothetical protein CMM46_11250 [Rhodospirillaceae bacterium]|nr:hypothetical protein [Rhodospirillaceae bacterium]|tara:strand:+ start:1854 stop:2372 length:519 start_codon:yes stop_codon:yes gene_type:complete